MKIQKDELKFSILMPVYNGANIIMDAINSILRQDFNNYEIIISDDGSKDNTEKIVKSIKDKRIKYYRNKENLGYGKNMEQCRMLASKDSEILFLMAQDDFLRKGTLKKTNNVFKKNKDVGAIIRPFYMFGENINVPIRDFPPYSDTKDTIISRKDGEKAFLAIFRTVCQLSGLAFRKKLIKVPFHEDIMTSHIYPFLEIFKTHKIMFLKDYTIAVRTYTSQTRSVAKIYEISPVQAWINLVETVFAGDEYKKERAISKKIVVNQGYVGLVQLKNFSTTSILLREYKVLLLNRKSNVVNPRALFYIFVTFLTPRSLLLPFVDFYKEQVLRMMLKKRKIQFVKA
ncbi:MAG: glycosyltransferase family 2 protein [Candidatus Levyibacteriota bacterium]